MMIISNIQVEYFASFTLAYITSACKFSTPQVIMTDEWVNKVGLDIVECAKRMMIAGKQLRQKATEEYEIASLRSPYRVIALMLNNIFGQENRILHKLIWIPLIYYVALEGTLFNWVDIISIYCPHV